MAQKRKTTKKKAAKRTKKQPVEQQAPQRRRSPDERPEAGGEILDNTARRDIAGVCFIVLGIVLMIFVCMPTGDAFFNGVASTALHYLFGMGCYLLPVLLAAIGVSYLYKPKMRHKTSRVALGLAVIYVSLLGIFAMFAPVMSLGHDDVGLLFTDAMLRNYGGYIGSALTWAGISFLGRVVTGVIYVTLVIIGFIIIGFSISRPIETAKIKKQSSEPLSPPRQRQQTSGFARVRPAEEKNVDVEGIYRQMRGVGNSRSFDPNRTAVFGSDQEEYLELPKPEFLGALYPEFAEEDDLGTSRLDAPELTENNTRRLVPIQHADSLYERTPSYIESDFASYRGFEPSLDDDGPVADDPYYGDGSYEGEPYSGSSFEGGSFYGSEEDLGDFDDEGYLGTDTYSDEDYRLPVISADPDPYDLPSGEELSYEEIDYPAQEDSGPRIQDIYIDGTKTLSVELDDEPTSYVIPALEPVYGNALQHKVEPDIDLGHDPDPEPEPIEALALDDVVAPVAKKKPESALRKAAKPKNKAAQSGATSQKRAGSSFKLPSMKLLQKSPKTKKRSDKELSTVAATLQKTLSDFGVAAEVVDWIAGPTVTLFEVNLPAGVRVSRVTALNDDIALALAAPGIRIFAPVPGTNYVGIEVPNANRETVYLSDVLGSAGDGPLEIAIGKDVEGHAIVSDLAKMPHLLIGGTTGSGKSVAINAMIMSILMRATPDQVRFILVDPKRVEFTPYNGIPHLYVPVVTEPKEAASALAWGVAEMERRLKVFSGVGARNITQYNSKAVKFNETIDKDAEDGEDSEMEVMPYIVIVIDELADLMMNVGKEVEISISRIAQLARAAGIHLIVATQRPSTNVVTGLIKANITNRIAFNVASSIDSRVILDSTGAENLIGLGDLLLSKPELAKPQRIQACFISESEIEAVVDFVKSQGSPEYHTEILNTNTYSLGDTNPSGGNSSNNDPLTWEAAGIVVSSGMGSTSNLQRRLKVGYARAGRIMDQLEELGIVGPANGSKPREVLVDEGELELIRGLEDSE